MDYIIRKDADERIVNSITITIKVNTRTPHIALDFLKIIRAMYIMKIKNIGIIKKGGNLKYISIAAPIYI